jgi:predicted restriction endonuclease
VMEDFSKDPGDNDFSTEVKSQYGYVCGCCGLQAGDTVIHNLSWYP